MRFAIPGRGRPPGGALLLFLLLAHCRQDMHDQPRYEPLEASSFFSDGRASRPLVEGTVARGQLRTDEHLYRGRREGAMVNTFPFPVTEEVLRRGQDRYDVFCAPCHDRAGTGRGMAVQRGFPAPPSLHTLRLRILPASHFFDVISNGYSRMYGYGSRISPPDRWAVVAYLRALQLSQYAPLAELAETDRRALEELP